MKWPFITRPTRSLRSLLTLVMNHRCRVSGSEFHSGNDSRPNHYMMEKTKLGLSKILQFHTWKLDQWILILRMMMMMMMMMMMLEKKIHISSKVGGGIQTPSIRRPSNSPLEDEKWIYVTLENMGNNHWSTGQGWNHPQKGVKLEIDLFISQIYV